MTKRTVIGAVFFVLDRVQEWVTVRWIIETIERDPDRCGIGKKKISPTVVGDVLTDLAARGRVQRRGRRTLGEWAVPGVPGADAGGFADTFGSPQPNTYARRRVGFWVDGATAFHLDRWATLTGMALPELARYVVCHEALRWVLATLAQTCRVFPGYSLFRVDAAPKEPSGRSISYALEMTTQGVERIHVYRYLENLPPMIARDGRGYSVEVVGHPAAPLLIAAAGVQFPPARLFGKDEIEATVDTRPKKPLGGAVRAMIDARTVAARRAAGVSSSPCPDPTSPSPTIPSDAGSSSSASPAPPPAGTTATC